MRRTIFRSRRKPLPGSTLPRARESAQRSRSSRGLFNPRESLEKCEASCRMIARSPLRAKRADATDCRDTFTLFFCYSDTCTVATDRGCTTPSPCPLACVFLGDAYTATEKRKFRGVRARRENAWRQEKVKEIKTKRR